MSYSWLTSRTPASRSSDFVNHSYDYTPNWTSLSSVTIINWKKKNLQQNIMTKVIYYITKKVQINLILKVSSPQRELLREDNRIFWKVVKVGCVHVLISAAFTLCPRNSCYIQSFCFLILKQYNITSTCTWQE